MFIRTRRKSETGDWLHLSTSQAYKIWKGYAFETLCMRHIPEIKKALGVSKVHTETSSFRSPGNKTQKGFQVDLIIERKDEVINLCECKYTIHPSRSIINACNNCSEERKLAHF